jgi:hypothetical protein
MADKVFERDGEVTAFWLVENSDGDQMVLVTPMVVPDGMDRNAVKEMMGRRLREDFKANGVPPHARPHTSFHLEQPASPLAQGGKHTRGRP